ncbi:MAG: HEAT repeat domain-containing protein [Isosphaeraceae bacterium]
MPRIGHGLRLALLGLVGLGLHGGSSACAQQESAVLAGVQYLRSRAANQGVGESAMIALALIKADVPKTDPTVAGCIAKIRKQFAGSGYNPQRRGGPDIYEAAVVAMALSNLDGEEQRGELSMIATFLQGRQNGNGSWDYTGRPHGDSSITQYALLGLWECNNGGVDIPPAVWDRAAAWYLSVQASLGGWTYHRDETRYGETLSMTAAGVGSLLLCRRQLERFRASRRGENPLLTPLGPENPSRDYKIGTSLAKIDDGIRSGMGWIGSNFSLTAPSLTGPSPYYALYGLERVTAFADREVIGRVDVLEKGRGFIRTDQRPDGSWHGTYSDEMNTAWAILTLTKSTAKSIQRIAVKRLGAGTLVGGRYLPKDLTSMTVAGGRIMSRPMNGAVEGMLAVLEDPRVQDANNAVSGLVERYFNEGPAALRPFKDRFRRLVSDRDPGVRAVGAWALARMGEMDVIPDLIAALVDPDERVIEAARSGLQLLSRKIDGLGPPSPSTPEQRAEAARRWKSWYESIRPLDEARQDGPDRKRQPDAPGSATAGGGGTGP